jgi:aspartyl-tRNA(Asn)/glutamyl-tRNA(Gln) amidotransferase subunit A
LSETALEIAARVRDGAVTAEAVVAAHLARIAARDAELNAFTAVFADQALADARAIDDRMARGLGVGPLAGVPFAVKNLFDVEGVVTLAGSKIRREAPPAARDAALVARLKDAGAILLGALNMDEFAYGFVTENAHDGPTRNPHDLKRIAGGSSGGSAAAVAAGLVPLALGSDTNGSVRVPAALCGVFGLKPTRGALSLEGVFPFVESLDHAGHFATTVADLALAWDVMRGGDDGDAVSPRLAELAARPLRVGLLGGWFTQGAASEVLEALATVGEALDAQTGVVLEGAEAARSAAFCLSAYEGGQLHLADLRRRAADYDPAVRDRLLAGALLPAEIQVQAKAFQTVFAASAQRLFARYDLLLAPTTPCPAPLIGQADMVIDGVRQSVRKNLGAYTQPLSFIGLPVLAAPVNRPGRLPLGVQIIADHGREDLAFAAAARLEAAGVVAAHPPEERA